MDQVKELLELITAHKEAGSFIFFAQPQRRKVVEIPSTEDDAPAVVSARAAEADPSSSPANDITITVAGAASGQLAPSTEAAPPPAVSSVAIATPALPAPSTCIPAPPAASAVVKRPLKLELRKPTIIRSQVSAAAVTLDEPELELAPPAPEPLPEQVNAPEPAEGADVALPDSPPPELQRAELETTGDEQVETAVTVPAEVAETTQPSVLEGAGTPGEATVLPTPGGEIDDTLQVMRLPRDDLSRVRQMIKAIDKFALDMSQKADERAVKLEESAKHIDELMQERAGFEQTITELQGRLKEQRKSHQMKSRVCGR
ncbi:mucin-7-like [Panicum hallii]|uniref:mucin-7-like n=1 Tax=Panicum hallii TaxID=206008 RepID=UPI000DF4CF2C|nr:mucin-7-like [Panicum hallii]